MFTGKQGTLLLLILSLSQSQSGVSVWTPFTPWAAEEQVPVSFACSTQCFGAHLCSDGRTSFPRKRLVVSTKGKFFNIPLWNFPQPLWFCPVLSAVDIHIRLLVPAYGRDSSFCHSPDLMQGTAAVVTNGWGFRRDPWSRRTQGQQPVWSSASGFLWVDSCQWLACH